MKKIRNLGLTLEESTIGNMVHLKAEKNGDKTFLRFEGKSFSYRQVHEISNRLANGLAAAGIRKGQHVAFMMDNKPEILWLFFAVAKLGGVCVPVNTAAKGELLVYYLTQSDSVVLVSDVELLPRFQAIQAQCPGIAKAIVLDEKSALDGSVAASLSCEVHDYQDLLTAGSDTMPDVEVNYYDLAFLLYTSGTTGPSKGNMEPHAMMVRGSADHVEYFGYQPDDVLYTCLPLFHGNALNTCAIPAFLADATLVVSRRFSARAFWDEVRSEGVTQFNLLGAMANIIRSHPASARDRDNKVRQCMMVPVPDFAAEFEERFGLKITSVYALTDFGGVTFLSPNHPPDKWRSAGLPREGVTVAILDDHDRPVPTGTPGEICVRSEIPWMAAQGYYKMAEATAESRRNLWFHTGDRGMFDTDGYLYFVDRKKDAIRRRGENISSYEIEQILLRHPAVEDVAAFAVNSEMSEDEVMVSIVCRAGQSLDPVEVVRFCQANMAYFMVPRYVELVGQLPRTMTEKVEKYRLKQAAQSRLKEIWDREAAGIVVNRHTN